MKYQEGRKRGIGICRGSKGKEVGRVCIRRRSRGMCGKVEWRDR